MKFDGNKLANQRTEELKQKIGGRKFKLVSIFDPNNMGAAKYTDIKAKKAAELGIEFVKLPVAGLQLTVSEEIEKLNKDETVNGIMVQLPFFGGRELVQMIDPAKDVDGMREDSKYMPAVVRGVKGILNTSPLTPLLTSGEGEVVVVGSKGAVGRKFMKYLPGAIGMDKDNFDSSTLSRADVVIACTGVADLITGEMVKDGFVAIDVGYPQPEFAKTALEKASFFTLVPGGVGLVMVVSLFENLILGA